MMYVQVFHSLITHHIQWTVNGSGVSMKIAVQHVVEELKHDIQ